MERNIESLFFDKKNLDFTFGNIRQNIQQRCDYDINNKASIIKSYNKMARSVYDSLDNDSRNLVSLNSKLIDSSTNYFQKVINKKKGITGESNMGGSSNNVGTGTTQEYMPQVSVNPPSYSQPNYPSVGQYNKGSNETQQTMKESNKKSVPEQDNILPFTLSDEFISSFGANDSISTGNDVMYNNIDMLEENEKINTMQRLEEYSRNRDNELNTYKHELISQSDKDKILTHTDDKLANRNIDLQSLHNRNAHANPIDLLRMEKESTDKIMADATNNIIANNSVPTVDNTNTLLSAILNYQQNNQPKYIEKSHFLSINSSDRNVQITTQNRYEFKVSLGKTDNGELGVSTNLKNIKSVEIIYAFLPEDTEILGYDNRLHLNTLSNPYLLLHVEELKGVYTGTNSNNDRCFSHLVIDKEQSTQSLAPDYTSSNINITDDNGDSNTINTFPNQFERSYLRYYPSCFDSKVFYNNPLASLGSMNIKITDPYGRKLNTHPDIISINNIEFEAASDKAIDAPSGFPRTALSDNKICKITLDTYVSNRLFKVGDKIRMSHIISTNGELQAFANRDEGHVIINLDAEDNTNTGTGANKGLINTLYVSPPGTLDLANGNLASNSYHETVGTLSNVTGTTIKGYVINLNLQSHFIFKVTTREANVEDVIKPLNV